MAAVDIREPARARLGRLRAAHRSLWIERLARYGLAGRVAEAIFDRRGEGTELVAPAKRAAYLGCAVVDGALTSGAVQLPLGRAGSGAREQHRIRARCARVARRPLARRPEYDPSEAIDLDGALGKLVQANYGPVLLFVVAAGLVCYGLLSLVEARH